jgi:CHAT domain-containing protein/Tfp pilus assembly protein PilF
MRYTKLSLLCLVLLLLPSALNASAQDAHAPTPRTGAPPLADEASIRALVNDFFAADVSKDPERFVKLWSARSPEFASRRKVFEEKSGGETGEVKSLGVNELETGREWARVVVSVELSVMSGKAGATAQTLRKKRVLKLVKEGDGWKVWQESSREEELADALLAARSEPERKRLLLASGELLTAQLRLALVKRGDEEKSKKNYAQALDAYGLARGVAEQSGDKEGVAAALFGSGTINRLEGKYEAASADLSGSLTLYESRGDRANAAGVLNGLGIVYYAQEDYERALEYYRRSLRLLEALGVGAGIANAQKNIGMVFFQQGNYAQALESDSSSLALSERLGDKAKVADMLNNIGIIHDKQGDYAEALKCYRKSLELYNALGNTLNVPMVLNNIGIIYEHQGDYSPALAAYQKVLEARESQGDALNAAIARNNLGNIYSLQGNFAQALEHYQRSLALIEPTGHKGHTASILNNIGEIYRMQGRYDEAIAYIQKSLSLNEARGAKEGVAAALNTMGDVRRLQGDYAQATTHYQRAQALSEELGDKRRISQLLDDLGLVSQMQGKHEQALEYTRRAATIAQQIGSSETLWNALVIGGVSQRALGDTAAAMKSFREAIATIESIRAGVAGGEQEQQHFFENKLSPYHAMIEVLLAGGMTADALAYAENAKARALLDVIRRGRLNITKSMTTAEQARERQLKNALVSLGTQLRNEGASATPHPDKLDALRARLQDARLEYEAFQVSVYTAHPQLKTLRGEAQPANITKSDMLRLLDADSALLEFVVTEKKTYLFVLTQAERAGQTSLDLKSYELGIGAKDLAERVEAFRRQIAGRDINFRQHSRELYDLLLEPAASQIRGKRSLVIVPDSALWELPFQALQADDNSYLLEKYSVSYAPSLTVLGEMRSAMKGYGDRPRATTLLALGSPTSGGAKPQRSTLAQRDDEFAPLPEAEREVKTLAQIYGSGHSKVYVGAEADEEHFKAEADAYGVLHLATHGVVNNANPMYSYVVLAPGASGNEDGLVEAWELMEMNLKSSLVVLSACETGRGRVGIGEGMIGLSWALFMAGSPVAVVSQWKVESRSTTELMLDFHRNLLGMGGRAKEKPSRAEALRQAALKLMKNVDYRHPFYWAGFIAVGDAR